MIDDLLHTIRIVSGLSILAAVAAVGNLAD